MTGATDGPRTLAQYSDMNTAAEFVERRAQAHKAGCQDLEKDPLVQAAMEDQRIAREWNNPRARRAPAPAPAGWFFQPGWQFKRQAE